MTAEARTTACPANTYMAGVRALILIVLYVAGAELGHALTVQGQIATFWPPSGIYVGALLLTATRRWPQVLLLAMFSNLFSDCALHGHAVWVSLCFWLANTAEAVVGAWLFRRFVCVVPTLGTLREVLGLSLFPGIIGSMTGATLGSTVVLLTYGGQWTSIWQLWWVADVLGLILFAPAMLSLGANNRQWSLPRKPLHTIEFGVVCSGLIVFSFLVNGPHPRPFAFLVFPLSIWMALRFELHGTCVANILRSVIALWGLQQGYGPFAKAVYSTNQTLVLQTFLSITSASMVLLAAIVMDRRRATRILQHSETRYRNLLENMSDLVHSVDVAGNFLYVNRAWCETLGYTVADIETLNILQIVHPEDLPLYEFKLDRLRRGENEIRIELRFLTKAGKVLVVEGSSNCRFIDDKSFVICSIWRDITSRHVHEMQLDQYRRQLEEANFQLQLLATTDGLTGLNNRRAFQNRLEEEVERSQRYHHHVSLLLLDVDHFKTFNDTYGHPAGDEVLKRVSRMLEQIARLSDYVARYGGEEFSIILPNTDESGAMTLAERLRSAIADEPLAERQITISIGVCTLLPDCFLDESDLNGSSLIQGADDALYQSKRNGRNQATHASALVEAVT